MMALERFSMQDKVVLVTGASRGIGRELAIGFAEAGARVAVNYRSQEAEALEVVGKIEAVSELPAVAVQADVSNPEAVCEMISTVGTQLGPIDSLVCSAGVTGPGDAVELSLEDWRRVLRVHLDGAFLCAREAVRQHMTSRQTGSIVMIGSIGGSVIPTRRTVGHSPYHTAKGGLQSMSRSLAIEWVDLGVRVNTLCPGYIDTSFLGDGFSPGHPVYDEAIRNTPMRRLGTPEDLVGPALFLASAASGFVTGQSLTVDGGFTAW